MEILYFFLYILFNVSLLITTLLNFKSISGGIRKVLFIALRLISYKQVMIMQ